MAENKFPEEQRNFETRLLFIRDLFENTYEPVDILAHCIQHKLKRSFESFVTDVKYSAWRIRGQDPLAVLKRIDK